MGTLQDARDILRSAEKALRDVAGDALREGRYVDVTEVARLADGLARLVRGESTVEAAPPAVRSGTTRPKKKPRAPKKASAKKRGYPRFERDRDRLIKVGWSKKKKSEYEHRAPFDVSIALVDAIRGKVGEGELFSATDILPLDSDDDVAIPDYQAYLALKWLHSEGIVRKHGRDRYALEPGSLGEGGLQAHWKLLPTSKSSKSGGGE